MTGRVRSLLYAPKQARALTVLLLGLLFAMAPGPARCAAPDAGTTRIVSLVPALTEMLFAIGAGEQVVGRSDYCSYPEKALSRPAVGALLNPSAEKIILLRPTVVLLYQSQTDTAQKLRQLGLETRLMRVDRLAEVFANLEAVGVLTGRGQAADALARQIRRELDDVRVSAAAQPGVRALVVVSRDPTELRNIYVSSPAHYVGELVEIAGGKNVISAEAPAAISKEQIIRANPDVILDLSLAEGSGSAGERTARDVSWKELSTVQAVRDGRVRYVDDPRTLLPGVGAGETAAKLFDLLHGGSGGGR